MRSLYSTLAGAFILALSASGCTPRTSLNASWKDPNAAPVSLAGRKILAVVQISDEARRRSGEDQLAAEITRLGGTGVPSYSLFPSNARQQDEAAAESRAYREGMSGIIIMHFSGSERTMRTGAQNMNYWRNDPYYFRPWGAWGHGWNTMWGPDQMWADVHVAVETRVYSLEQRRLLWAGSSETQNPNNTNDVIRDLANVVAKELKEVGVLSP